MCVKPTGWLTNADFLRVLERRCPGYPKHPRHPPLQGRALGLNGKECWLTSLAAEYPQGLCEEIAKEYQHVAALPIERTGLISMWAGGRFDPCRSTKRVARNAENGQERRE